MPIFLIDTLKAKNSGTFALVEDSDLKGGFRAVADTAARDAIPAAKRSSGMLVYTVADAAFWVLGAGLGNGDWSAASFGSVTTPNGDAPLEPSEISSLANGATETIGTTFALPDNSTRVVDVEVVFSNVGNLVSKVFDERRIFRVSGSAVNAEAQESLSGPFASPPAGILDVGVAIEYTGAVGRVEVTNNSGGPVRVRCVRQINYLDAPAGSVPAAPLGVAPSTGSTAGNTAVIIEVADSTGLTGAKIGGVALGSFAINDATHVSGTTAAHSAGAVDVVVSNTFGDSPALVGGFTYTGVAVFDPATLPLTEWVKGSYTGAPWAANASAGTSGTNPLITGGIDPIIGSAVDGKTPASFGNHALDSTADAQTALPGSAYTIVVLAFVSAPLATSVATYDDPSFATDNFGFNFGVSSSGLGVAHYQNATSNWVQHRIPGDHSGAYAMFAVRYDGTNVYLSKNAGAESSAPATASVRLGGNKLRMGLVAIATPGPLNADVMERMVAPVALSTTDLADIYSYFKATYPSMGLP